MEEEGRDALGKTPLAGHRQQEGCTGDRKEITEIVKERRKKRELGLCQKQAEASRKRGLGRETALGRPLSKGFRLRVWAKEAVKFRQMLCPDGLLALWAHWLRQGAATCNQHCGTGLSLFVASLKILRWTCGNGAAAVSSRAT